MLQPVTNLPSGLSGNLNPSRQQLAGTIQAGSIAQFGYANQVRAQVGIVGAFQSDDQVTRIGRIGAAWVPAGVVANLIQRGANWSCPNPPSDRQDITAGTATLHLTTPADSPSNPVTDPTFAGWDWRFAGLIFDVSTSNNINPGQVSLSLDGYFENGEKYHQDITVNPGHMGVSRYYVIFTQETQGGAYPALVRLWRNVLEGPAPGVSAPITTNISEGGPTSITFTNGLRTGNFQLDITAKGNSGTSVYAEMLDPVSSLWYSVMSGIQADINAGQAGVIL